MCVCVYIIIPKLSLVPKNSVRCLLTNEQSSIMRNVSQ